MGTEERRALGPALLQPGVHRREQELQGVEREEEVQSAGAHPSAEDAEGVLEEPGRSAARDVLHRPLHRRVGPGFDVEVELAREPDGAKDAHRILAHSDLRIADGPHLPQPHVAKPADEVDHPSFGDVVEQPVDGEVAPPRVLLRGAEDVVIADEEVVLLLALGTGLDRVLQFAGVGAEGGDLHDLPALEVHVRQAEPPADEAAVPEDTPHLARQRAGRDVEVLGRPARQEISDAAADQVRLVPVLQQPVHHLQRVGVELVRVDVRCMVSRHRRRRVEVIGVALPQGRRNRLRLLLVVGRWRLGNRTGERIGTVLVLVGLLFFLAFQVLAGEGLLEFRVPGVVERCILGTCGGGGTRGRGGIVRHQR